MRRLIRECANTFRFLFGFDRKQDQLDDELQFHIEEAIEERVAAGQSFEDARRETLREFGNINRAKEECREAWGLRSLHNFRRDVSYSLRRMRHEKGFAAVVSLTFALGIGLNTMIFSLFNSLWLNPRLYPDENRIVRIYESYAEGAAIGNPHERGTSPHFYIERTEQSELAEAIALTFPYNGTITGEGMTPEYLSFFGVTFSLPRVLGVEPVHGRWFTEAEAQFGNDNVAVLSTPTGAHVSTPIPEPSEKPFSRTGNRELLLASCPRTSEFPNHFTRTTGRSSTHSE